MDESNVDAQIAAQREKVLDEIKRLDDLYDEAGFYREPRNGTEVLTHAVVITSWHKVDDDGREATGITDYRLTPMATWIAAGLARAGVNWMEAEYLGASSDD